MEKSQFYLSSRFATTAIQFVIVVPICIYLMAIVLAIS